VWVVGWSALALLTVGEPGDRALLLLIALLVPLGLGLHVWNVARQGVGRLELTRIAFWPPEWWGMWWPRTLRRPGDLWTSLPWPARLVRGVLSTFFVAVPVMTNQDLVENEHMVDRGFIAVVDQPDVGLRGFPGAAFHMGATPLWCGPCPALGQHNAAVLGEFLGLSEERVGELLADGTLFDRPLVP